MHISDSSCIDSLLSVSYHHHLASEATLAVTDGGTMQQALPHDFLMVARSCALTSCSVNKQLELELPKSWIKLVLVGAGE